MKSNDPKYIICWKAKRYCREDITLIENYGRMIADYTQIWCCHHRREIEENKSKSQLIEEGLYYSRPSSELIFLTSSEHTRLHKTGVTYSEDIKKKLSDAHKGKTLSEETKKKMSEAKKNMSEDTKKKIGEAMKGNKYNLGKHWWNNGIKNVLAKECPEGYEPGRIINA